MAKSIEHRIRFEAAIIYTIVAIGIIAMIVYLNGLHRSISSQRSEITEQQVLLSVTNRLIFTVGEAQSASGLYLSTKRRAYLDEYTRSVDTIARLIDTIATLNPGKEEKLLRIEQLLRQQAQKIAQLNFQFTKTNPVTAISERLQEYEPESATDTLIVNVRQDTVIAQSPKKGFFKRLGEVFKPKHDSVKVIVNQRVDTVRTTSRDSLGILSEVGGIARAAGAVYDSNIKAIERQVTTLIVSDQEIAREASTLLQELHRETLNATISVIDASEKAIGRNYLYSVVGGMVALILILIFIGMILTDINKGRKARHALEAANEQIRRVMESRHLLLLSVSHDIKSPLNSILGYLETMQNEDRVRSMRNSSEHILSMLENLLEFSSLEQGTLQVSLTDFNLRDLCRDIYEMFVPLAAQKSLTFSFEADDARIHADRVKIKQIVINLVSNAVKYTQCGSVGFHAKFDGEKLEIAVLDTGAGIPEPKLPLLFKPFSRIEENNKLAGGSGLGMFVVKGLADLMGGRIGIVSAVGVGTTVTITLPVSRPVKEIPQGMKRIRVCDDDPVIVKMVSDQLTRLGHRVTEDNPDLILTDWEMGEISGLDILREAGDIPVVVMTGRGDFTAQKAAELGFDGFLPKPFTINSLRGTVGDGNVSDDLLGDNKEEIIALFRTAATENFARLEKALAEDDYATAQALCHKMYPMFAQLGYPAEELRRMDMHRAAPYEEWREDVRKILSIKV